MSGAELSAALVELRRWFRRDVEGRLEAVAGGPARLRVIVLLAGVLGLSTADTATVGAIAAELKHALGLTNTDIGLLVSVSTGVGAVATLPIGVLTDRVNRTRLLWISILIWSAAMIVSGAATSFVMLLLSRVALGAVVATATPVVASLIGDLFQPSERGRIYGYILTGELVGTGVGFLVSGDVAGALTWRAGLWWLAVPGLILAGAIRWYLPEPARGGYSRLALGDTHIPSAQEVSDQLPNTTGTADASTPEHQSAPGSQDRGDIEREVHQEGLHPHTRLVLHDDPTRQSLWWAVRYILSIRTNRMLIIASGLGYFFLQGLETFAVVFMRGRFGLGQSSASTLLVVIGAGAIVGVLLAGRIADRLIARGHITARPSVAGTAFLIAALLFVPGLLAGPLLVAAPLFFLAAAGLGAANPPLDAARLDIMRSRLWGRAESVRTALRTGMQAIAPLLFGYVSTFFGGQGGLGYSNTTTQHTHSTGLGPTFLIMLIPLGVSGLLLLLGARRTYPRDVATAIASEHATATQPQ